MPCETVINGKIGSIKNIWECVTRALPFQVFFILAYSDYIIIYIYNYKPFLGGGVSKIDTLRVSVSKRKLNNLSRHYLVVEV